MGHLLFYTEGFYMTVIHFLILSLCFNLFVDHVMFLLHLMERM